VLVVLVGATFAGQGLGYVKGSVMTGDMTWFWIGGVMVVVGLVLGFFGFMRRAQRA
jgi:F0F1-type ATP synthase assembly protein I